MPDIFLSYNREDVAVAQAYRNAFAREGLDVWWDATLRSGETYDEVTEAALRGAKAVVVLWSPRSVASRWVRAEATIAYRNQTLAPVTIEPCDRPVMFELTQTAELIHWRGAAGDKAWLAFLDDVRRMVGREATQPAKADPVVSSTIDNGPALVAVLPFACRGADPDLEILAEDMTEEITRQLADNGAFHVIGAATMSAWRGRANDHRALRRDLGAAYALEGKLQQTGESLRLTLHLTDTATGSMLKSSRFSGKLAEVAAAPDEFLAAAAIGFGEHVDEIETKRALAKTGPLSAWEHVLRSINYRRTQGTGAAGFMLEEARQAVAAAPNHGLAHAALAFALSVPASGLGGDLDASTAEEIRTHLRRAMQLDGTNPAVIFALIPSYALLGEVETCLGLARRTAELAPGSPSARFWLGVSYAALGRTSEAIPVLLDYERLTNAAPNLPIALYNLGMCYFLEGRLDEAEAALDRALVIDPELHLALKWKAIVLARQGREAAGVRAIRRMRELEPELSLENHLRQMIRSRRLGERADEPTAILRRLWQAAEGSA
jgi:TolB-like protein/Tfp pilus assembly protein PilF